MPSDSLDLTAVVLAAGQGTRMKSQTPKVLHTFAGRTLLGHVLAAVQPLAPARTAVVIGHGSDAVGTHLASVAPSAVPVLQGEQNGTGHATRLALAALDATEAVTGAILVLPGDAPLLTAGTLAVLAETHKAFGAAATVLTSEYADPTGYGRIIRGKDGAILRIVEQRDADPDELAVHEVNAGVYVFDAAHLRTALSELPTDNAQSEQYLTDVVGILVAADLPVAAVVAESHETAGVNDQVQLSQAHRAYNDRLLREQMLAGVRVMDPATTWVDATVVLSPDAVLLPSVELHGTTTVATGAVIGPQSSLTDTTVGARSRLERVVARQAVIGADVTAGPFAYLRPGTEVADRAHIGTYVEVKASQVGSGAKVPHLTYVGDARIGDGTNIGASSVFVNYDGVDKHRTVVGDHVRIGSDTMLVAPVTIGDGAYTAAGSVITEDVPPGDLGVSRSTQRNVKDWVLRRRAGTPSANAAQQATARANEE